MICFDEASRIFYLENPRITYAFCIDRNGSPQHIYFGKRLPRELVPDLYPSTGSFHAIRDGLNDYAGKADISRTPAEFHTPYGGDYYEASLVCRFPNGNRRTDFRYIRHEILSKKPELTAEDPFLGVEGGYLLPALRGENSETLCVTFSALDQTGAEKGLLLKLYYTVYEDCDVIARSLRLVNKSDRPIHIERAYSYALALPERSGSRQWRLWDLHGSAGRETQLEACDIPYGTRVIDSNRGCSSAVLNPAMVLAEANADELRGTAYGVNLVHSGSFELKCQKLPSGMIRLTGGISSFDFEWKLDAGGEFVAPEAILACSDQGLSGLSRCFHHAYRLHLIPRRFVGASRPVVINHWEATRFTFDAEKLKTFIDSAAGRGIDTFVLDDGWFGKRDDASSSLGDWFTNEQKLPGGLKALIDYAHSRGLKFGLWFEPEMISRDSELYRAHPDWALQTPDEFAREARTQLMLDLGRPEVREYLAKTIGAILDENSIDYVKWDCNRDPSEGYSLYLPADRQREVFHRQILGAYALCRKLIESHPQILFEGCASGGGRFDPAMLHFFPQIWTSDQTDAAARCRIQYGNSLVYPLSAQSCHVSKVPNRRGAHLTPFAARFAVASLGAFGYELDLSALPEDEQNAIPDQVAQYHRDEALVLEGELYRLLSPFDGNYFAEELILPDKSRAKVVAFRMMQMYNAPEPMLYPVGLEETALYRIPELEQCHSGAYWMERGILPAFGAGDCVARSFHLERQ